MCLAFGWSARQAPLGCLEFEGRGPGGQMAVGSLLRVLFSKVSLALLFPYNVKYCLEPRAVSGQSLSSFVTWEK